MNKGPWQRLLCIHQDLFPSSLGHPAGLHFPTSFAVRYGRVTYIWPMGYGHTGYGLFLRPGPLKHCFTQFSSLPCEEDSLTMEQDSFKTESAWVPK